jgi:ATP-dependent DNA helicase RecQ
MLQDSDNLKMIPSDIELACLVRQAIGEAKNQGYGPVFELPPHSPWGQWPTDDVFLESNLNVVKVGGRLRITPKDWLPGWLTPPEEGDPFRLAFEMDPDAEKPRQDNPLPTDPAIREFFSHYRTPGQKEAIRATLGQPEGTTLTINLPTGTGKTLAVLAPALSYPGTTIVIVPTTALAIDQEKRLQDLLSGSSINEERFAYHGGLSKEEKEEFKTSLASGFKKVVFTSPEALLDSLFSQIVRLSDNRQLRALVIDEAHIVDEWGTGFRSEFQLASGFRRWLMKRQSDQGHPRLRTILLTGTLTTSSLETLHTLFGEDGQHEVVASMGTRPEISYWRAESVDSQLRRQRLVETLKNAAMPCIVYVTRRTEDMNTNPSENVRDLKNFLVSQGFTRIAAIDGGSTTAEKEYVIAEMPHAHGGAPNVDITVANSAFGLGIDIEGLRTVIHVCVPETVERFYQEAGRAGRDGRYATHIWMPAEQDWKLAQEMAEKRTLTRVTAESRWNSMYAAKKVLKDGAYSLDTRATHGTIKNGDTDLNTAWNNRTITMMARARMIEIEMLEPPKRDADASDTEVKKLFEDFRKCVSVRSLDLTSLGWSNFEAVRTRQIAAEKLSVSGVRSLGSDTCMNSVFQKTFTIENIPTGVVAAQSVKSQFACAGCPVCRNMKLTPRTFTPIGIPATLMLRTESTFTQQQIFLFNTDLEDFTEYILRLIKRAQSFGYTHYIIDTFWNETTHNITDEIFKPQKQNSLWTTPDVFVDIQDLRSSFGAIENYGRPTLILPSPDDSGTVETLLSTPAEFGRSSMVVTSDSLYLPELQRKTKEFEHLRVESSADLEKIMDLS